MGKKFLKNQEQMTSDQYILFPPPEDVNCSFCSSGSGNNNNNNINNDAKEDSNAFLTTKRKILILMFIASLALLSIIMITEQLIERHMTRKHHLPTTTKVELDILTLEDWVQAQHGDEDRESKKWVKLEPNSEKIIEDGIFWTSEVEAKVAPGPSDQEVQDLLIHLRRGQVSEVREPDWLHCGRGKNRYVLFEDGGRACARNRDIHPEYIQGEVMAFYLARLLGITHTPAVALSKVNSNQWADVNVAASNWKNNSIVALIQWIPHLTKTNLPFELRETLIQKLPSLSIQRRSELLDLDDETLAQLVQWSDLILFDYLTGNYDRVASMQDSAILEQRPAILRETIHNLGLSTQTSSLWFLDNEASFLSAYSLLYTDKKKGNKFQMFHKQMLKTMCIFRRKTINRLFLLKKSSKPADILLNFVEHNEPLFQLMPKIYENSIFMEHFGDRLNEVWEWVGECHQKSQYL